MGDIDFGERGAAVVEMAFMTIFLVVLVMGIIDIGRAIFTNISIQEAAQEGASFGAFDELATVASIKQRAVNSTSEPTLSLTDVTITCTTVAKSKKQGTRIEVTVQHQVDLITPVIGQWLGGSINLSKVAGAERFYSSCPA